MIKLGIHEQTFYFIKKKYDFVSGMLFENAKNKLWRATKNTQQECFSAQ